MDKRLLRILIGGGIFLLNIVLFMAIRIEIPWLKIALYIIAFIIIGGDVIYKAVRNVFRGKVFDENFLMSIATIGALAIQEFPEAVAVMLFYQVGEFFQNYAVGKSRKSIASLMDIRPDYANLKSGNDIVRMPPEDVKVGDIIIVSAGERIPLDGKVIDGFSMLDTSALTGESVPREAAAGDDVISGCINVNGVLTIEVTKPYGESTVSKILDLVENAGSKKSNSEKFITRFAKYYTPSVVAVAVLLAIVPPLVIQGAAFMDWLYRALTFLVVSCPCALVISIPMSFFGGIGGASRSGVLIKGSNYLEALAKTDTVVFDKTGTLTKGVFKVQKVKAIGISEEELLEYTAHAESYSNHPISIPLREAYGKKIDRNRVVNIEEMAGHGLIAMIDDKVIAVGNAKLMKRIGVTHLEDEMIGTAVHIAIEGAYAGYILIADEIKEDARKAIKDLKKVGITQTVMLTGDLDNVGKSVGRELGLDKVYTELLPEDKVQKIEELLAHKAKGKIAFVGDGINDAPVLARADIGIAMGGLGSDAAIEAADIVIMNDEPSKIAVAKRIARKTLSIATMNIIFAIAVKVGVLILSAFGITNMWMAIFADVGVAVIAILNAFRALTIKDKYKLKESN